MGNPLYIDMLASVSICSHPLAQGLGCEEPEGLKWETHVVLIMLAPCSPGLGVRGARRTRVGNPRTFVNARTPLAQGLECEEPEGFKWETHFDRVNIKHWSGIRPLERPPVVPKPVGVILDFCTCQSPRDPGSPEVGR